MFVRIYSNYKATLFLGYYHNAFYYPSAQNVLIWAPVVGQAQNQTEEDGKGTGTSDDAVTVDNPEGQDLKSNDEQEADGKEQNDEAVTIEGKEGQVAAPEKELTPPQLQPHVLIPIHVPPYHFVPLSIQRPVTFIQPPVLLNPEENKATLPEKVEAEAAAGGEKVEEVQDEAAGQDGASADDKDNNNDEADTVLVPGDEGEADDAILVPGDQSEPADGTILVPGDQTEEKLEPNDEVAAEAALPPVVEDNSDDAKEEATQGEPENNVADDNADEAYKEVLEDDDIPQ